MYYQLDPSLPFASKVNPQILSAQRISFAAQYNQVREGYPGDLLAGTICPGTTLPYSSLTTVQQDIAAYYFELENAAAPGNPGLPPNFEEILKANPGPTVGRDAVWNLSYNGWGMDPTVGMSPLLKIVSGPVLNSNQGVVSILVAA